MSNTARAKGQDQLAPFVENFTSYAANWFQSTLFHHRHDIISLSSTRGVSHAPNEGAKEGARRAYIDSTIAGGGGKHSRPSNTNKTMMTTLFTVVAIDSEL